MNRNQAIILVCGLSFIFLNEYRDETLVLYIMIALAIIVFTFGIIELRSIYLDDKINKTGKLKKRILLTAFAFLLLVITYFIYKR